MVIIIVIHDQYGSVKRKFLHAFLYEVHFRFSRWDVWFCHPGILEFLGKQHRFAQGVFCSGNGPGSARSRQRLEPQSQRYELIWFII